LNIEHPLYQELKSIVFKTIGVEGSLKKVLRDIRNIRIAFIYGSFAAKDEEFSSDIDVMIIGEPDVSLLNEKIRALEHKIRREVDTTIYSLEEYRARKSEKSGFIGELLENPKIMIIGDENDL
jgi:predicted nucleotidyltransferase